MRGKSTSFFKGPERLVLGTTNFAWETAMLNFSLTASRADVRAQDAKGAPTPTSLNIKNNRRRVVSGYDSHGPLFSLTLLLMQAPSRYYMLHKPYGMESQFISPYAGPLLGDLRFSFPEG